LKLNAEIEQYEKIIERGKGVRDQLMAQIGELEAELTAQGVDVKNIEETAKMLKTEVEQGKTEVISRLQAIGLLATAPATGV
jgi:uncharacterized protein (UPF0335 family)